MLLSRAEGTQRRGAGQRSRKQWSATGPRSQRVNYSKPVGKSGRLLAGEALRAATARGPEEASQAATKSGGALPSPLRLTEATRNSDAHC